MFGKHKTDVIVVGAGPVGLVTALMLAARDVKSEIYDQEWRTAMRSYALALHPRSLELLDELGVASAVLEQAYRVDSVAFYDGTRRRAETKLSGLSGPFPFVAVLPQSALETILESALNRKKVKVNWNHRLATLESEGDSVVATVEKLDNMSSGYAVAKTEWAIVKVLDIDGKFAVGADGFRSKVRRFLDIPHTAVADPQFFAVFEFKTDIDLDHEMKVILDKDSTNVLWPLPDGRCRWSFQVNEAEIPADSRIKSRLTVQIGERSFPFLDEETLTAFLRTRAPWFEGKIEDLTWSMAVRFEHRLAGSFGRDRCWLVGDSAHMACPVGAHSMNLGFQEAHDLVTRLNMVVRGLEEPEMVAAYAADALAGWRQLLGIEGFVEPLAAADPWVKENCQRFLPCIPASGDDLADLTDQLGLKLRPTKTLIETP